MQWQAATTIRGNMPPEVTRRHAIDEDIDHGPVEALCGVQGVWPMPVQLGRRVPFDVLHAKVCHECRRAVRARMRLQDTIDLLLRRREEVSA